MVPILSKAMVDDILIHSPPEIDIVYIINISTIKV